MPTESGQLSIVEQDLTVTGQLDSTGEIHLYGTVAGDVKARRVILRSEGSMEGEIRADEAEIYGQLKGRVIARTVVIGESARIQGQVFHHKIDVAKGAHIEGRLPWRPVNYFDDANYHIYQAG